MAAGTPATTPPASQPAGQVPFLDNPFPPMPDAGSAASTASHAASATSNAAAGASGQAQGLIGKVTGLATGGGAQQSGLLTQWSPVIQWLLVAWIAWNGWIAVQKLRGRSRSQVSWPQIVIRIGLTVAILTWLQGGWSLRDLIALF